MLIKLHLITVPRYLYKKSKILNHVRVLHGRVGTNIACRQVVYIRVLCHGMTHIMHEGPYACVHRHALQIRFLVSARVALDPHVSILNFLFIWYETMSNCSQIGGLIGILLCCALNDFSHIFARFVRPLLATIQGKFGLRVYNVTYFPVGKKQKMVKKKVHHHTNFIADRWPETVDFFFLALCFDWI